MVGWWRGFTGVAAAAAGGVGGGGVAEIVVVLDNYISNILLAEGASRRTGG